MAQILSAATGWPIGVKEILEIGERRLNMLHALNAQEGFTREEDQLPKKFLKPLLGTGPTAGVFWQKEELERTKDQYYRLAGWEIDTGNPGPDKLKHLGLEWILK